MIPALNSTKFSNGILKWKPKVVNSCTFSMGKEAKQIDPLLFLKIIVPFVFPLIGFLLPPLLPVDTLSESDSYNNSIQEEEEEDEEERYYKKQMDSLILASQTELIPQTVVRVEEVEEEPSLREEINRLKNRVSDIEERESQLRLEFSEYCNAKKYESLLEKLQIMCLGLKTEYLEKQNQRLEESIAKLMEEKQEFEATTDEIKRLKKNFKKISKRNEHNMLMVHQRMQDYDAREVELLKSYQELEMAVREVKNMIEMKENCTSKVEFSLLNFIYVLSTI
jgi:predicted  nucleic acid-binding Zn-ribbon protein